MFDGRAFHCLAVVGKNYVRMCWTSVVLCLVYCSSGMSMMLCSIFPIKWGFFWIFFSFEGFPILVLVKVLLQILVPWNNYLCKIVLPISGFFLVFLYYFDCVDPMLPRNILILDGPMMYVLRL